MRKYLGTKGLHATGAPSAIGSRGMGVWGLRNIDRKSLSANNRGPPEAEDPPRSREDWEKRCHSSPGPHRPCADGEADWRLTTTPRPR